MTTNAVPSNTRTQIISIETYADGHYQIEVKDRSLKTVKSARLEHRDGHWRLERWQHRDEALPNRIVPTLTFSGLNWDVILQELS